MVVPLLKKIFLSLHSYYVYLSKVRNNEIHLFRDLAFVSFQLLHTFAFSLSTLHGRKPSQISLFLFWGDTVKNHVPIWASFPV